MKIDITFAAGWWCGCTCHDEEMGRPEHTVGLALTSLEKWRNMRHEVQKIRDAPAVVLEPVVAFESGLVFVENRPGMPRVMEVRKEPPFDPSETSPQCHCPRDESYNLKGYALDCPIHTIMDNDDA